MDYSSTQRLEAIMQLKLLESISCIGKVIPCGSQAALNQHGVNISLLLH